MGIINKEELEKKISADDLETLNGGAILDIADDSKDTGHTYQLIDDNTGAVIASFDTLHASLSYARENGISTDPISWSDVQALREKSGK